MPTLKQVLDAIDQVKHNPTLLMRDFDDDAGRGRGANTTTFQHDGDEEGDKGVWMSVWVDDVDEMHKHCVAAGLDITFPPDEYAVERPRDAPSPSRWPRLPRRSRLGTQKIEPAALKERLSTPFRMCCPALRRGLRHAFRNLEMERRFHSTSLLSPPHGLLVGYCHAPPCRASANDVKTSNGARHRTCSAPWPATIPQTSRRS